MNNYKPQFGFPVCDWFEYFAWRPVYTEDRGWRWLKTVYKRRIAKNHDLPCGGPDFWFQYAVQL